MTIAGAWFKSLLATAESEAPVLARCPADIQQSGFSRCFVRIEQTADLRAIALLAFAQSEHDLPATDDSAPLLLHFLLQQCITWLDQIRVVVAGFVGLHWTEHFIVQNTRSALTKFFKDARLQAFELPPAFLCQPADKIQPGTEQHRLTLPHLHVPVAVGDLRLSREGPQQLSISFVALSVVGAVIEAPMHAQPLAVDLTPQNNRPDDAKLPTCQAIWRGDRRSLAASIPCSASDSSWLVQIYSAGWQPKKEKGKKEEEKKKGE